MRKNNDGYVLPFVLVVMIVLTIISTSLMTAALRNLQSQQKFTERMVDKYQAEGEIEKIVAQLSGKNHFTELTIEKETGYPDLSQGESKTNLQLAVEKQLQIILEDGTVSCSDWKNEGENLSFTVKLGANVRTAEIAATIQFSGKLTETSNTSNDVTATTLTYSIDDLKLTYNSYEISTKEVPGE